MNKTLKSKTLSCLNLLKMSPKRSLGQNFLINDSVVNSILEVAEPESFDKVFEVGPGLGSLTNLLNEKSKKLILLEFDKKICHFWQEQGFEVKQTDALCFDWRERLKSRDSKLLVSNLPYQIASRLLVELSVLEQSFNRMVLMFQKEVARRILAKSGTRDYGFLTVIAKNVWNIHFVLEAGTVDFFPKPRVASQVLCFNRKKQNYGDFLFFSDFVRKAFTNRRKKLLPKLTCFAETARVQRIFKKMNLNEEARAEELTPEQLMELALWFRKK